MKDVVFDLVLALLAAAVIAGLCARLVHTC